MATETTNPFEAAAALFGKSASMQESSAAGDPLLQVAQQIQRLYATNETLIEATKASTQVAKQSSAASGGESVLGTIGKSLQLVFGAGLGLSPLISGIASLFGGAGETSELAPVVKFALPRAVQVQAGKHQVRVEYVDGRFKIGLVISVITLVGCLVGLWRYYQLEAIK